MKKRVKINILSYALSFILMIAFIGISLLTFGKYSLFSSRAIIHTCERIGYYSMMLDEINEEAIEIGIPYGVSSETLEEVFKVEEIRSDIMDYVYSVSDGQEPIIDTSTFGSRIVENVKTTYTATGEEWTDKQEEALQEYIVSVGNMYQKSIEIPGMHAMANYIKVYNIVLIITLPVCLIIATLCILFLVSIRSMLFHALRFIGYSIFGTALTLVMTFAAMLSNGFIYKINISAPYMRKFFTYLVGHAMLLQIITGIFIGAIGLIFVFIIYRLKVAKYKI